MKYTEKKERTPFNWNEFLNRKNISSSDWNFAESLSDGWVTCACGSLCEKIPRHEFTGEPRDARLYNLGMQFNNSIMAKDAVLAKEILSKIEKRSSEILNDLNKLKQK